jgi:toxin ParE1/3/4
MREVVFGPRAADDLIAIADDTKAEWGEPQAKGYVDTIRKKIEFVAEYPGAGSEVSGLPPGYRKVGSGSHRVIYRYSDSELNVVRVIHERQDVPDEIADL